MTDTNSEAKASEGSGLQGLGRAWIPPGLVLAGLLGLGRVELLVALAESQPGAPVEWARWSVLADWPAQIVQALMMGAAAAAVASSAQGSRRPLGIFLGALICASALTGWPMAPVGEVYEGGLPGFPSAWHIGVACLGASALVSLLAGVAEKRAGLRNLLSARPLIVLVAALSLGIPAALMQGQSQQTPQMLVREVLFEFNTPGNWRVDQEDPMAPVRAGTAVNRGGLIMSPPCEVALQVPMEASAGQLSLRPQLPVVAGLQVRFEVQVDGVILMDEVLGSEIGMTPESVLRDRSFDVSPGQELVLRTSYVGDVSTSVVTDEPLECGFAELVLDRWIAKPRAHASPTSPNVVLITVDGLRADRVSCYGYSKRTTPNLDALALEGVRYANAYSTSSGTLASTASILTGRLPYAHGALVEGLDAIPRGCETLAEGMQLQAVTTAAIIGNPNLAGHTELDQGFESFDVSDSWRSSEQLIPRVESQLKAMARARFFLYVQLSDPIAPIDPLESEQQRLGGELPVDFPEEGRAGYEMRLRAGDVRVDANSMGTSDFPGRAADTSPPPVIPESHLRWISDSFDAGVASADKAIGRILQLLHENGLTENTLVVVTGTHGYELFEHGSLGYGHSLHTELVKVPLIIAGLSLEQGVQVSAEVSNRRLGSTLIMLGPVRDQRALNRTVLLDSAFSDSTVFYQTSAGRFGSQGGVEILGLRGDGMVVHYSPQGAAANPSASMSRRVWMYSSETDPLEQVDLLVGSGYEIQAESKMQELQDCLARQRSSFDLLPSQPDWGASGHR